MAVCYPIAQLKGGLRKENRVWSQGTDFRARRNWWNKLSWSTKEHRFPEIYQIKPPEITQDICGRAGKWTQTCMSCWSRWSARPQFSSFRQKQASISFTSHIHRGTICFSWISHHCDLGLCPQAGGGANQRVQIALKLVKVDNEKWRQKQFSVRRYWE